MPPQDVFTQDVFAQDIVGLYGLLVDRRCLFNMNDAYRLADNILGPTDDDTTLLGGSAELVLRNFGAPEP